jgi:drug/metabolite transporter (DMT)-like permease
MPPQDDRTLPSAGDYGLLLALGGMWGASFLLIKIGVESVPALPLTTIRLAVAALFMCAIMAVRRAAWPRGRGIWALIVFAALSGNALPFALIGWGEERIDSGLAAILMAPMPLIAMVLAHVTINERLSAQTLAGVCLGLAGLLVLIGPGKLAGVGGDTVRELAVASAGVCYAVNAVLTTRLVGFSRLSLVAAVSVAGAVLMLPMMLLARTSWDFTPSAGSLAAITTLGIVQSAGGTLLMFALVGRQGASFFSQVNFLVPMFGVLWGTLILAERPSPNALAALGLILLGLALARRGMPSAGRTPLPAPEDEPKAR